MDNINRKTVRIGCSSGFWGDSPAAAFQLVTKGGHLDYLVSDYLAEITMCILARSKNKLSEGMGEGGYVREFIDTVWKPLMKQIISRNIKVVTNAGGMNPFALKKAIEETARISGLNVKVAAVLGDDLLDKAGDLRAQGKVHNFSIGNEKEDLWPINEPVLSFNAYIGAFPIAEALRQGAQVVVTGRCVDSAVALGPLIYEFGWKESDYDLLSSGSLAGHIIECGCQATGGNFTDWEDSYKNGWDNVGYPIVECFYDGSFVVTKPEGTGGIVNNFTVSEQMLYEIGDPSAYVLPDVVCDWRYVQLSNVDQKNEVTDRTNNTNRVLVKGAKGRGPTSYYKVSVTTVNGYRIGGMLMIGGIDARKKAFAVGESIFKRTRNMLKVRNLPDYTDTHIEVLGSEHTYGPNSRMQDSREVFLRLVATHSDEKALLVLARELAPAALAMAPGITGGGEGRPRPTPIIKFFSCLIKKDLVPIILKFDQETEIKYSIFIPKVDTTLLPSSLCVELPFSNTKYSGKVIEVPLINLCLGRSGDKGDASNIGLISRKAEYYPFIRNTITEEVVYSYMKHLVKGKVIRYEVPGIYGLNFMLTKSLGSGGVSSMLIDRQGKSYAQMLLSLPVKVPIELASLITQSSKL